MAKKKLNVDWKAILLAHGEKAGALVVAILVGMVVWNGTKVETLPASQTPSDIESLGTMAEHTITSTTWENYPRPLFLDYGQSSIMDPLDAASYRTSKAWDPLIFNPQQRRRDPDLYTVEDLQVHSGFGAFAMLNSDQRERLRRLREESGDVEVREKKPRTEDSRRGGGFGGVPTENDDEIVGQRWVCVTGFVRFGDQRREYDRALQKAMAYLPESDQPRYVAYLIERAEIQDGAEPVWSESKRLTATLIRRGIEPWACLAVELAEPRSVHKVLTYPLGPLTLSPWNQRVVHPEIPFKAEKSEPERKPDYEPQDDPLAFPGQAARRAPRSVQQEEVKLAEKLLFRYFDFTVEPGKQYRYRVRLQMIDPNYRRTSESGRLADGVEEVVAHKFLEQSVVDRLSKEPVLGGRYTDWSQASPTARVPRDGRLFAEQVNPGSSVRYTSEPEASILVKSFDVRTGMDAAEKFTGLKRGSIANFTAPVKVVDPRHGAKTLDGFRFRTDMMLLDLRGGAPLPQAGRDFTDVTELLFFDITGRLVVRSELEDLSESRKHQEMQEALKQTQEDPITPRLPFNPLLQ